MAKVEAILLGVLCCIGSSLPVNAQAPAATAAAAHYTVAATPIGKLLDDPASNGLLKKLIPTVYGNEMFQQSGRAFTLKDIQQYEPDALSNTKLAEIQAEFDKLPVKP